MVLFLTVKVRIILISQSYGLESDLPSPASKETSCTVRAAVSTTAGISRLPATAGFRPSLRRLRMCGGHSCAPWPTQKQTCCAISRCCFLRTGRKLYMRDSFRLRYPAGSFCSARACHSWHSLTTASFACWATVAENGEAAPMLCACAVAGWRRGTTQGGRGGSPEPGWWWKREVQFWRS